MKNSLLSKILRSERSVFSFQDLAILTAENDPKLLAKRINYYVQSGEILNPRKGIYTKDKNYQREELASKIFIPSYISLYTVLRQEGLIFQYSEEISSVSYLTRSIEVDAQVYSFNKIKDRVLMNPSGIIQSNNFSIACLERAFLDTIYLFPNSHFDNLDPLDWDQCFVLSEIYRSKALVKRLVKYYKG